MVRFSMKNGQDGTQTVDVGWGDTESWRSDRDMIHDPDRLRIMAQLAKHPAGFQDLRQQTRLVDKDLAAHTKRLEAAGFVETESTVGGTGLIVTFQATKKGQDVLQAYREWVLDVLA